MSDTIRKIRVQFRWPVEQIGPDRVLVQVPVGGNMQLVSGNEQTAAALCLSNEEFDRMVDAAEQAALQEIVIKR